MPIINIRLPDGTMKKGEMISTASIAQIKEEIFLALLPNEPIDNYNLVHLANQENTAYHNFTLMDNDTFIILSKKSTQSKAFNKFF